MKGVSTLGEYIAGCTFIEGAREFQFGEKVTGLSEERLKYLSHLSGWEGKKMVYIEDSSVSTPENKSLQINEVTAPVLDEEDEDDEVLQKASLKVLRQFAKQEGIKGASKMEKGELIAAIKVKQSEQGE